MAYLILYLLTGFVSVSYTTYKNPPKTIDMNDSEDMVLMVFAYVVMVFFWPVFLLIDLISIWIKYLTRRGNERKEKQGY